MIDINSISSVLHWFSQNMVVKIRVNCYTRDRFMLYETEFFSESRQVNTTNLNLNYRYYLTLESIRPNQNGEYVRIPLAYSDLFHMKSIFMKSIDLFRQQLWKVTDGELRTTLSSDSFIEHRNLRSAKITFGPGVVEIDGEDRKGIDLEICDLEGNYIADTKLSVEHVIGNYEFFSRVEPATMAQLLVNYMQVPRPGTSRTMCEPRPTQVSTAHVSNLGIPGRQIGNKRDDLDSL